ncbi:MAG: DUF4321 domain-containing protein [Clostridium sp.]|nr:DUF4321 domain-containing protein [Clostridium sp.]
MASGKLGKNNWALFLMILAGIVIGGFIGWLTKDVSFLSWLNFGQSFGLAEPVVLDLGIIVLTFGLSIKITIGGIIGIIIGVVIYRLL